MINARNPCTGKMLSKAEQKMGTGNDTLMAEARMRESEIVKLATGTAMW